MLDLLMRYRETVAALPLEAWEYRAELTLKADRLEHELTCYNEKKRQILALVGDWQKQREATAILNNIAQDDLQRKLTVWVAGLKAKGLLDGQVDIDVTIPPHKETMEEIKKMNDETRKLEAMRQAVMGAVSDQNEARVLFSRIDLPFSKYKLEEWVSKCIRAKLLPRSWRLADALGKMLHGPKSNKMHNAVTDNKVL